MDFMFMGPKDQPGETMPCLAVREDATKTTMATAMPSKSTDQLVVRKWLAFLQEIRCTYRDVIVKTNQESTMTSIIEEIGRTRAM